MLKFLSFFSCGLLLSGSISQAPPAAFPDTPIITEISVGKAKIGMPVARLKELYKGCSFAPTHMLPYGFDDTDRKPNGVTVSSGNQKLFIYYLDGRTKKIAGLLALHTVYKTAGGIHVGSTASQLKMANPAVRVVPNMMLPVFQTAFVGDLEKPGIEYIFYKQKSLGKYEIADEPAPLIASNAKIAWLQLRSNL
jgi:hypothetical protein